MSIEALVLGKLHQRAEQRTSKTGHPFVTAKARTAAGAGESVSMLAAWWPCALVLAPFAVAVLLLLIRWGVADAG